MNIATATIVEERREPIASSANPAPQVQYTAEYVYEQFVSSTDQAQITRLGLVREMTVRVDTQGFKKLTNEMVDLAHQKDIKNGVAEKVRGPLRQQAMNARTIMRAAFGAIKYAKPQLDALGYSEKTGYLSMAVLAKSALKQAGRVWTGEAIPDDKAREHKAALKDQAIEAKAFKEVTDETLRKPGESLRDWQERCFEEAERRAIEYRKEATQKEIAKQAVTLIESHGREVASAIAQAIINLLESTEDDLTEREMLDIEQPEDEMPEEQAEALLREHVENEAGASANAEGMIEADE